MKIPDITPRGPPTG